MRREHPASRHRRVNPTAVLWLALFEGAGAIGVEEQAEVLDLVANLCAGIRVAHHDG